MLFKNNIEYFNLKNAELIYHPNFLNDEESNQLYNSMYSNIPWKLDKIRVYGKTYNQPRLTALYGNHNIKYEYSNISMQPKPFTEDLLQIKQKLESEYPETYNTILLNLYRNGNDSNGWHADNEKSLGKNPIIASLSLGCPRYFHFKHRTLKNEQHKILLENGSLLIMKGEMQHFWLHQIAKTKKKITPRINLTFRMIK